MEGKQTSFREACYLCYAPTTEFRKTCELSEFEHRKNHSDSDAYLECKYFSEINRQCHNEEEFDDSKIGGTI